mmetsp:Transcript_31350/g.60566  ORF Transcript_31350/g.60566 Transcript_31350/m.60566 type:complete len:502 (-) Transcript_31350:424-1929(-)
MMGTAYGEDMVGDIIQQIQVHVFPRRVRLKEFFRDCDPLRSGRCTAPQMARAVDMAGVSLTDKQTDILATHFSESGVRVQRPQVVNYAKLCNAVDEVFGASGGNPSMMMTSSPSSTLLRDSFQGPSGLPEDELMGLLHKVAVLCKTRGIVLKYCYTDHDRAAIPSPSRMNPNSGGKVTKNQFIRNFPFQKEFSEKEMDALAECYKVRGPEGTAAGDVHFMALHNDVMEAMHTQAPPFPRSDLFQRPDNTEWSHNTLHPLSKIQSKVVEKRVRLYEHFQDFDALRKGVCTVGQTKTVFTMMNIAKELDRSEFEMLMQAYMRDDGMFCYKQFCADVDRGFTTPHLEKDPLAVTTMPDASSTWPGRRNRIAMSGNQANRVAEIEDKIRSRVRKRGVHLKPTFQDFDKVKRGHVTRGQFSRIMGMLGFELDEASMGLLASAYCDLGNHHEVNYVDFLQSVDPPDETIMAAMESMQAPHQGHKCSNYFDARGTARPMDATSYPMFA